MTLKDKVTQGLKEAIASRGKNKGMLKAKCPKMNTYGSAVWNALMMHSNPYKVGFGHMILMDNEKREVYEYVYKAGKFINLTTFDKDGQILKSLGLM